MLTKPIAVVGLAVGVIVAAGAGAYLAVRQNASAPPQLVEADAESLTSGLASTAPGEPAGTAVEATEAVVDTRETAVSDDIQPPAPERETPRGEPVAAPPPPTPPSSPTPAARASAAAPEPTPAVFDPTAATVAEAPPADPAPVQTARADLPAVEGWTRPEVTESSPETAPEPSETASIITDIGSIDRPAPEPVSEFVELEIAADSVIRAPGRHGGLDTHRQSRGHSGGASHPRRPGRGPGGSPRGHADAGLGRARRNGR